MAYSKYHRSYVKKEPKKYRSYFEYDKMENEIISKKNQLDNQIIRMAETDTGLAPVSITYGFDENEREKRLSENEKNGDMVNKYLVLFGLVLALSITLFIFLSENSLWYLMLVLFGFLIYFGQISEAIKKNTAHKREKIKKEYPRYEEYIRDIEEYSKKYRNHLNELREKYKFNYQNLDKEYWEKYFLNLSGPGFEIEMAKVFDEIGYKTELTNSSGDKGIDIKLHKDGVFIIVQCKAHKTKVGPHIVRDLYGALSASRADKAVLASLSGFTEGVIDFVAEGDKPIILISLQEIVYMKITKRTINGF